MNVSSKGCLRVAFTSEAMIEGRNSPHTESYSAVHSGSIYILHATHIAKIFPSDREMIRSPSEPNLWENVVAWFQPLDELHIRGLSFAYSMNKTFDIAS